jgi:hypothetical protein
MHAHYLLLTTERKNACVVISISRNDCVRIVDIAHASMTHIACHLLKLLLMIDIS